MKQADKIIAAFLKKNPEFSKIRRQGQEIVVYLRSSEFEYKVSDFSLSSPIRAKLEKLQEELGLPIS